MGNGSGGREGIWMGLGAYNESTARDDAEGVEMRRGAMAARRLRGRFVMCGCKGPFGAGLRNGGTGVGVIIKVDEQDEHGES